MEPGLQCKVAMSANYPSPVANLLENAIAAEQTSEDLFSRFSDEGEDQEIKDFFRELAKKSRVQHQRLTTRLKEMGGDPSTLKSVAAHFLGFSAIVAQRPQSPQEKDTQHLITTYASAASEIAMYESLAVISAAAGDPATAEIARQLQQEEKTDHEETWKLLGPSAARAFHSVVPE